MKRRAFFGAGATAAALAGGTAGGLLGGAALAGPPPERIPNVEVWTHEGRKVRFYDDLVRGRVVTFNFMFVGCGGTCPLVTQNLREVQDLLGERVGREVFMYSVSLQPEIDTPAALRDYAELWEVRPGWEFLTGRPDDIEHLRTRLGFRSVDPALDVIKDEHTGLLRYGSEPLDRWGGTAALARPEWIAKAITSSVAIG